MTRADTINMARAAGFGRQIAEGVETIERFADMVAAAKQEQCAKVCDDMVCTMTTLRYENKEAHNVMATECASRIRALKDEVDG